MCVRTGRHWSTTNTVQGGLNVALETKSAHTWIQRWSRDQLCWALDNDNKEVCLSKFCLQIVWLSTSMMWLPNQTPDISLSLYSLWLMWDLIISCTQSTIHTCQLYWFLIFLHFWLITFCSSLGTGATISRIIIPQLKTVLWFQHTLLL